MSNGVIRDPVCGMEVEVETEIIKGVTYYFCCEECEETFETQDDKDQPICT